MSRAAGGTYTLPAGNPVITGTVISSTWANTTLTDIATALTDSLSRTGLGSMTASLFLPDGTAALPSLAFTNSTTTGLYRGGADILGFSTAGVSRGTISAAGNWTIPAPTSGTALDISSTANDVIILRKSGTIYGYLTADGTGTGLFTGANETGYGYYATPTGLSLQANNAIRLTINSTGNVTIAAPSSGTSLTVNGLTGANTFILGSTGAASTLNTAWNVILGASWNIFTQSTDPLNIGTTGAATLTLSTNSAARLTASSAGNVTINNPSSGAALTVNGQSAGTAVASFSGSTNSIPLQVMDLNLVSQIASVTSCTIGIGAAAVAGTNGDLILAPRTTTTSGVFIYTGSGTPAQRLAISGVGTVTINAPAAASPGLIVTGSASTPVNAIGNSSTAFTIDFSRSNVHTVTMTGNVPGGSLTLSNAQDGQTINVFLTQDGTGTRTLGYPASVKWPGGVAGILSTPINTVDLLTLTFRSSTGFYYASLVKAFA